jgi:4-oxalomesaconate tautomerase
MEGNFHQNSDLKDRIILSICESSDFCQIDGFGEADSLTSKLALIAPPKRADLDIDDIFGARIVF